MRLVEADPSHIPFLAAHMRPADVDECRAFGRGAADALTHGLCSSLWALTAIVEGEPHAMMGVSPLNMIEGLGVPWMLGTERIYDHGRDLVRHTPAILGEMLATFPRLENFVSTGNVRAIRFIRFAGFEFRPEISNVGGVPFVRFAMGASVSV